MRERKQDTKERILDAAERLFADLGFAATSLRDITTEAGVNLAAVHYHFGSKLSLLSAVFARRFAPVNAERLSKLDELEAGAGSRPVEVEEVLRAFFAPIFERLREPGSGWTKFMQLVGRTHSDTSEEIRSCFVGQFEEVARRFTGALQNTLPELPQEVLRMRTHFVVGAMAHTFAFCRMKNVLLIEAASEPEEIMENLVAFAAAGLRTPVPLGAVLGDAP